MRNRGVLYIKAGKQKLEVRLFLFDSKGAPIRSENICSKRNFLQNIFFLLFFLKNMKIKFRKKRLLGTESFGNKFWGVNGRYSHEFFLILGFQKFLSIFLQTDY